MIEAATVENSPINVNYTRPKFFHRIMAGFIDLIVFLLVGITLFWGVRGIVSATPSYKKVNNLVDQYREESGLYIYSNERKTYELVTTYLGNDESINDVAKVMYCTNAIDAFFTYIKAKEDNNIISSGSYDKIIAQYNEERLSDTLTYEGVKLFILEDGNVVKNQEAIDKKADSGVYYTQFYKLYIQKTCVNNLVTLFPEYYDAIKHMSNCLLFIELPIAYVFGSILVFYVPGLFFKKGRKTLGNALFHIGFVNGKILSPTFWQWTLRSVIFIFAELLLPIFTFGVPLIISFTMMAFSKKKQGFTNYMLNFQCVDTTQGKIYMTRYDAIIDNLSFEKTPTDFNLIHKE